MYCKYSHKPLLIVGSLNRIQLENDNKFETLSIRAQTNPKIIRKRNIKTKVKVINKVNK
jgi:hypothetical protein